MLHVSVLSNVHTMENTVPLHTIYTNVYLQFVFVFVFNSDGEITAIPHPTLHSEDGNSYSNPAGTCANRPDSNFN